MPTWQCVGAYGPPRRRPIRRRRYDLAVGAAICRPRCGRASERSGRPTVVHTARDGTLAHTLPPPAGEASAQVPRRRRKTGRCGEYGNRVQGPNGTAAVYAEKPHRKVKAAHRASPGRGWGVRWRRESEDLLACSICPTGYGLHGQFSQRYGCGCVCSEHARSRFSAR